MPLSPEWVSAAADVLAAAGVLLAAGQYRRDGRWKQKERIQQFFDAFKDSAGARNAALMLDSRNREVPLWDASDPKDRYVRVTWADVERALVPPSSAVQTCEPIDTAIRDCFEDLLNRFAGLERMAQEGLIRESDLKDALRRWFFIIGERDKDKPHIRNLRLFIVEGRRETAMKLFRRFDIDLKLAYPADVASFQA